MNYLSEFLTTFEMPIINCEINLILIWSTNCVISTTTKATILSITDTTFYVPVVTLSTKYDAQLLQQLNSELKQRLSRKNKIPIQVQNNNLT